MRRGRGPISTRSARRCTTLITGKPPSAGHRALNQRRAAPPGRLRPRRRARCAAAAVRLDAGTAAAGPRTERRRVACRVGGAPAGAAAAPAQQREFMADHGRADGRGRARRLGVRHQRARRFRRRARRTRGAHAAIWAAATVMLMVVSGAWWASAAQRLARCWHAFDCQPPTAVAADNAAEHLGDTDDGVGDARVAAVSEQPASDKADAMRPAGGADACRGRAARAHPQRRRPMACRRARPRPTARPRRRRRAPPRPSQVRVRSRPLPIGCLPRHRRRPAARRRCDALDRPR